MISIDKIRGTSEYDQQVIQDSMQRSFDTNTRILPKYLNSFYWQTK